MKKSISLWSAIVVAPLLFYIAAVAIKRQHLIRKEVLEEREAFHYFANRGEQVPTSDGDEWKELVGYWQGTLDGELRLLHRITPTYGQVFTYSLDQGGGLIPASATRFNETTKEILMFFSSIGGVYQASLDQTGEKLTGTWKQGGRAFALDMYRFQPSAAGDVPREFRFLLEKTVTGDAGQLVEMAGFWSGSLDDEDEAPELVIFQVEKVSNELVEPKLYLPDESPLPCGLRSFVVNKADGQTKIVLDDPLSGNNAVFHGVVKDKQMIGTVQYDDTDYTPPLTLVWSEQRPTPKQTAMN